MDKNILCTFTFILLLAPSKAVISLILNNSLLKEFHEIDYTVTKIRPTVIIGIIIDGKNYCDDFPPPSSFGASINSSFLMLFSSEGCSLRRKIKGAHSAGYRALVVDYLDSSPKTLSLGPDDFFLLLYVHTEDALFIRQFAFNRQAFLIFREDRVQPIFHVIPLVIAASAIIFVFSILGVSHAPLLSSLTVQMFYLGKFISGKISERRARRRVFTLPTRLATSNDTSEKCPICWDQYTEEDILTTLTCKHEFHQNCLRRWVGDECPLCRTPIYDERPSSDQPPETTTSLLSATVVTTFPELSSQTSSHSIHDEDLPLIIETNVIRI